jgi:hypothetical protein
VAQLGARFHGMEEVVSSNLTRSTKTKLARFNIAKEVRGVPLKSKLAKFGLQLADLNVMGRADLPGEGKWSDRATLNAGARAYWLGVL